MTDEEMLEKIALRRAEHEEYNRKSRAEWVEIRAGLMLRLQTETDKDFISVLKNRIDRMDQIFNTKEGV